MSNRQYATPLVIRGRGADEKVTKLHRIRHDDRAFDESWFQERLFQHPELLPAVEIEPAFDSLRAVAEELPVDGDSADLLFVNPDGCIALVETKLFRNPEARRQVIAQAIDYASELSGWTYEQLVEAIKRANKSTAEDPLLEIMRGLAKDATFDERRFKERVSRNLQLGRILLLVVGDQIRDGVERMAEFIHLTPHLHFTIGLVEMALFREDGDSTDRILVQPRVVAQTQLEVRSVVEIRLPEGARTRTEVTAAEATKPGRTITEQQFYEELGQVSPAGLEFAKSAIQEAGKHHLGVGWGAGGAILKYRDEASGEAFNFGQLWKSGELSLVFCLPKFRTLGLPEDIATDYLDDITRLVPGSYRQECAFAKELKSEQIYYPEGSKGLLPLAELAPHKEKWFQAIDKAVTRLQAALKARGQGAA